MKVAVLGYGTVGAGVYSMLSDAPGMEAGPVIVRPGKAVESFMVSDAALIFGDPTVDAVVETLGGLDPAYSYGMRALEAGKHFITANKVMVASHGLELAALAREKGAAFLFSAACGGGVPFLHNLALSAETDRIEAVSGILNGTTNYMLDAMQRRGLSYGDALREAQSLGYAESDPTADVSGLDALRKKRALTEPLAFVQDRRMQLDFAQQRLAAAAQSRLGREEQRFARNAAALDAMSPLKVLGRGYAMVQAADGSVLRSARQVQTGDRIEVRLGEGTLGCRVEEKKEV